MAVAPRNEITGNTGDNSGSAPHPSLSKPGNLLLSRALLRHLLLNRCHTLASLKSLVRKPSVLAPTAPPPGRLKARMTHLSVSLGRCANLNTKSQRCFQRESLRQGGLGEAQQKRKHQNSPSKGQPLGVGAVDAAACKPCGTHKRPFLHSSVCKNDRKHFLCAKEGNNSPAPYL